MKVLALNGSPRRKASSTYHMLVPLLEGMQQAGAETKLIHIAELNLHACTGCYICWVETPGKCVFHDQDGMAGALQDYNSADLVIFGTPLYYFNMSSITKIFIDRTLPRLEPWLVSHPLLEGLTAHPERFQKPEKIMLVSACGFPEFDNFKSLVTTFRQIAQQAQGMDYIGEILRPSAEPLSRAEYQDLLQNYYDFLRKAGDEIIHTGAISANLQAALREDLFPGGKQAFYEYSDTYWQQRMEQYASRAGSE